MSAKALAYVQLNLETAGMVEETAIDQTDKIMLTTSTQFRSAEYKIDKS